MARGFLLRSLIMAVLAGPAAARAQEPAGDVPAVLDLTLNTTPRGEIRVLLAGAEIWADVEALEAAGLVNAGGLRRVAGDRTYVRLSSIDPPLHVVMDEAALTLTLTADATLFARTMLRFDAGRPDGIVERRATSAFLNYGATWATGGGRALNLESGVSLGASLLTSSFFLSSGGHTSRGMTAAIIDDTARLRRYQIGDAFVATGPLGGSLQLAGVSVSRDFSLDPYFIRYPTTGLSGVVTTPSRVDLYVNRQLVRSIQVQPGAYELANLALPTGAADTRVVVRDAFGGRQEFGGSYYVTTSILARGLQQYHYAFGAERLRQFDSLWAYGRAVLTGTHRVGLTDSITAGGRLEAEPGLFSAGPTLTTRLGRFGALEMSAAASRHRGRSGAAGGVAYEYVGRPGTVSVAWRQASDAYETLTSRRMRSAPRRDILASASARLTSRVTLTAGWQSQDVRGQGGSGDVGRASLTSTVSLGPRLSLFVSAVRGRYDRVWSTSGFAALSLSVGPRRNASLSAESIDRVVTGGVDVQQSAPIGPGIGYRMQTSGLGAGAELIDGELRAQARWAQLDVRQTFTGGARETWAQVNGALVGIGGRVLATRPVQNGFALVRVPAVKGVRAYVSQQEMGRTDRRGDLLLPNLLPFYGNQISIADADVPADRTLTRKQLLLATPYRGGAIAEFPAIREWRASGTVVLAGDPEALHGQRALDATLTVQTPAGPVETWLAADGAFYIEGLAPGRYEARVVSGALACAVTLDVPPSDAPVVRLGPLPCRPPVPESGR